MASKARELASLTARNKVSLYLEKHGSITPIEALTVLGVHRLAPRIMELRRSGFPIKTEYRRDMNGRPYARYRLVGGAK